MSDKRTIAIDFDGVIHKYSKGFHDGTAYDVPTDGAFEAIDKLRKRGYHVYVLTARPVGPTGLWFLKWWPSDFGDIPEISNTKKPAIAYIDDRGMRFTNWTDMLNYF